MTPQEVQEYLDTDCNDRGPRIGEDGVPYCCLAPGHDGPHKGDPLKGWRGVYW